MYVCIKLQKILTWLKIRDLNYELDLFIYIY